MIDQLSELLYTRSRYYLPLVFTLACSIFAFACFVTDPGPVLPPFDQGFDTIDCRAITFKNYTTRYGAIDMQCSASAPVQFPSEYLPHFLSAWVHHGGNQMPFQRQHFENLSLINNTINLTIVPRIAGPLRFELKCLDHELTRFELDFEDMNETENPQFSMRYPPVNDSVLFSNVCAEDDKIVFFTPTGGYGERFKFDGDGEFGFQIIGWSSPAYQMHHNVTRVNDTSFVLPGLDPIGWKSILFNLMPIANAIALHRDNESRRTFFLFKDLPPKGALDAFRRLSLQAPSKLKPMACYKKLVFPYSRSHVPPDSSSDILNALRSNFTALRAMFPRDLPQQNKIVIANSISQLEPFVVESFPNWSVTILGSHFDVCKSADLLVTTNILIGNHISNLMHMVWMKPNRSAVIDLTSAKYSCNHWAREFALRNDIAYFDIYEGGCTCPDFSCYPRGAGNLTGSLNTGRLKKMIDDAIEIVTAVPPVEPTPTPDPRATNRMPDFGGKFPRGQGIPAGPDFRRP
jgi:hypothetical protein